MRLKVDPRPSESRDGTAPGYRAIDFDCGGGEPVRDAPPGHAHAPASSQAGTTGAIATAACGFPDPFEYLITDRVQVRPHPPPSQPFDNVARDAAAPGDVTSDDTFTAGTDRRRPPVGHARPLPRAIALGSPVSPLPFFAGTQSGRMAARVELSSNDGYPLTAMRYAAAGRARAHLIVAGATGVPQRFYRRFAEFAASAGYSTLTFDYRGIGLSAPTTLRGFKMDYFDWGRLDLAAAVDAMSSPPVPLYIVGHSYGGHAFGVLPNHHKVAGFYTFGTGAGWHGWMPPLERIKVLALWHVLGPLLTQWTGYLPCSRLGMGEDLPLDFYRQWKKWCRYPNNFFGDPAMRHVTRRFDQVLAPLMAANSIDDPWSPPRSRDAFMAGYRNAARHTLDIDPADVGLRAIGHMGYFMPGALPLWESALAWLDAR